VRYATLRPLVGLLGVAALVGVITLAATLFRGGFTDSVPVTVLSQRAGLVMNPDAKVMLHGVQVGRVSAIEDRSDGTAAIHLAIDPKRIGEIPADASVDITSATVFGAKAIHFVVPENASPASLQAGQVIDADHVMLEINTLFEQLVSVLSAINPDKLNETLGALSAAVNGRGEQIGRSLADLNEFLSEVNPHIDALNRNLAAAPVAIGAYADAGPDLMSIVDSAVQIGRTVVEKQTDLDRVLVSAIGMADLGDEVLTRNGQPLTEVMRLLLPTTTLADQYRAALTCGLGGVLTMANNPPLNVPGVEVMAGFMWGQERYRYPNDVPKVAAKGGPQCTGLPAPAYGTVPPFVITDTGTNPWRYTNPGITLNSDLIKQILFGPIAGPPRNSAQIGQPG
jgi:phospholipid/cholesterol/gamma-HCH transport system substrate-binding protein